MMVERLHIHELLGQLQAIVVAVDELQVMTADELLAEIDALREENQRVIKINQRLAEDAQGPQGQMPEQAAAWLRERGYTVTYDAG